jgi:hypothetical protein
MLIASLLLALSANSAQAGAAGLVRPPATTVPGDLTLDVPMNLTRLSPFIASVAVTCTLQAPGVRGPLTSRKEVAVSAGQLVGSIQVVFPASQTASFMKGTVDYECVLTAFSTDPDPKGVRGWHTFDKLGEALVVSPVPGPVKGDFIWY